MQIRLLKIKLFAKVLTLPITNVVVSIESQLFTVWFICPNTVLQREGRTSGLGWLMFEISSEEEQIWYNFSYTW